ncbi:MAG: hypothetical protein ACR2H1_14655 [Limisphaerales bacterium]
MNEWNIQARAHGCQVCKKPFADQEPYHTLLFEEKEILERLDICEACWKSQFSEGGNERKNFISYWQGIYEAAPPAPDPIQKERAETLLRNLMEENNPKHEAVCFILAVMLERKRLLKIKEQLHRDGQRIFIYEQPKTGDLFTIADPDLQLNQLDEVQRDVAQLLEHGLNPPPIADEMVSPPISENAESAQPVVTE